MTHKTIEKYICDRCHREFNYKLKFSFKIMGFVGQLFFIPLCGDMEKDRIDLCKSCEDDFKR